jgi:MFS family permease
MLASYRPIFDLPHARRLIASALVARIPYGINPLATVLLARSATGSFADAGAVAAGLTIGWGAVAPLLGRLVDRYGQRVVLLPAAAINAAALVAMVAAAGNHASAVLLVVLAAIAGGATPPLSGSMRALWVALIPEGPTRTSAFALETVLLEVGFISGPLLTGLIVAIASPSVAVLVSAGLMVLGTLALTSTPPSRDWKAPSAAKRSLAGPLAGPGVRTLILAIAPSGLAFGTLAVAIPAIATRGGTPATAGLLAAAFAAGSLAGGLWYGSRNWQGPVVQRYLILTSLFAAGLATLLVLATTPVMVILFAVAGAALAPLTACEYSLIDEVAPPGTATEAFTWLFAANMAGSAAGSALAGAVIQSSGIRPALLIAVGGAALSAPIILMRRRTLGPRSRINMAASATDAVR